MSSKARVPLDVLSGLRKKVADPKSPRVGDLSFLLKGSEAQNRERKAGEAHQARSQPRSKSNATISLLERLAATNPNAPSTAQPIMRRQPNYRRRDGPANSMASMNEEDRTKLNNTRSRVRRTPLPDPLGLDTPRRAPAASSLYRKEVSSLDRLAAESGIDSSTNGIRKRRSYTDRVAERPAPPTRFSLPRSTAPGGRSRRPAAARTTKPGETREKRMNKAQEEESIRMQRIADRKAAAKPAPIPYSFDGIDPSAFSPILAKLSSNGGKVSYERAATLNQGPDATRLVVSNPSILRKSQVLGKIGTWIPEVTRSIEDQAAA